MNKRYGDGIASRKEVQVNISRCFSLKRRARPLHYSGGVDRSSPSERKKKKAIRAAIERSCHSRSNFSAWTNVSGRRPSLASPFAIGQSLPLCPNLISTDDFDFSYFRRALLLVKEAPVSDKKEGKYICRRLKELFQLRSNRTRHDENDSLR